MKEKNCLTPLWCVRFPIIFLGAEHYEDQGDLFSVYPCFLV